MKLLLDECLPRKLKFEFKGHEIKTSPEMGWAGKKNGELLSLAAQQFDGFITVDQNLSYQQNLEKNKIAIIVLIVPDSRFETIKPLVPSALEVLKTIQPREIKHVR